MDYVDDVISSFSESGGDRTQRIDGGEAFYKHARKHTRRMHARTLAPFAHLDLHAHNSQTDMQERINITLTRMVFVDIVHFVVYFEKIKGKVEKCQTYAVMSNLRDLMTM